MTKEIHGYYICKNCGRVWYPYIGDQLRSGFMSTNDDLISITLTVTVHCPCGNKISREHSVRWVLASHRSIDEYKKMIAEAVEIHG